MALTLYAHPFSSYCQKVLMALYENATPFSYRALSAEDPLPLEELKTIWPIGKFPVLLDDGAALIEASIIIEHVEIRHPGPIRLIPRDPAAALEVRFMDRFFDNYVATPQQTCVFDALRAAEDRDPTGVTRAKAMLDTAYAWLEAHMVDREWAAGAEFSLADCSAAPQLFYADWTHPLGDRFPRVSAYRRRLNARPSFARCIEEARPYRNYFPLGAPDRD
jgi:glutathione S-transferase